MKKYEVKYVADGNDWGDIFTVCQIKRNGKIVNEYYDCVEPEDCSFSRDWNWISGELKRAYEYGYEDGKNEHS